MLPFLILNGQNFPSLEETFRLKQLTPPSGKVRMILDTDTYNEVDDQFAIAYALFSSDRIDLQAVYAAPYPDKSLEKVDDSMEKSYQEILRLLKFIDKPSEGFAFRGSTSYLESRDRPVESDAVTDLIQRAMASSPGDPLYVVAIGCITNIASALLIEPKIMNNIVVVWVGTNASSWPHQREYNLKQDVLAAQVILNSGVPLVLMPAYGVVSHLITTVPELKYYLEGKNELSDYLVKIIEEYAAGREAYSKAIWDIVAIAWLIDPSWVSSDLVHSPILTDQLTFSEDKSRHFIRVATTLKRDAIFKDLFEKLSNYDKE